ncbi:helix-turn-helix transcriptional regulator [Streptacidiphilus anmyonensis]|uniref:helix-turn-helix transcriptional regulator n=1 Tax=Streptacidiphilus anmyonensis TaxID=405782 RepID=UPI0006934740|nr:AraC family transcriptional regulator [Streptacidiphilus anmyonensis]
MTSTNDSGRAAAAAFRPRTRRFSTSDPESAARRIGDALRTRFRMASPPPASGRAFELELTDLGPFRVCGIRLPGEVTSTSSARQAVFAELMGGAAECRFDGVDYRFTGEGVWCVTPRIPFRGRTVDLHARCVVMPMSLLEHFAGPSTCRGGRRFTSPRPVSQISVRQWRAATAYVGGLLEAPELMTPLVMANATGLLAATALAVFPNTFTDPDEAAAPTVAPTVVRQATAYIEEHAHLDLTVGDIANQVHLTPRALQYAFRRHLETTPFAYLRRVRLDHARRELLAADPATSTVAQIAARWGFLHQGRFAALYRATYQDTPRQTLRA